MTSGDMNMHTQSLLKSAKNHGDASVWPGRDNLSASWNAFIKECRRAYIILLNDDIQISNNFGHLIDAMKQGPSTVYSCVSNAAPWGNYIHQQEYHKSHTAIWKDYSAQEWPQGPGGFVIGLSSAFANKVRRRTGTVFNESVPWGGNEAEFNRRIVHGGIVSSFVIVHSCFVYHQRKNSWLKRPDAWAGN